MNPAGARHTPKKQPGWQSFLLAGGTFAALAWLHGTLRLNVPQQAITVGVPAYRDPGEVTLPKIVVMPFQPQRPTWQLPGDGTPTRTPVPAPAHHLLP
jgi:hypothetical protein